MANTPDRGHAELIKRCQQRNLALQQSVGTAVRAEGATGRVGGGRDRSVTATCAVHPGQLHDFSEAFLSLLPFHCFKHSVAG